MRGHITAAGAKWEDRNSRNQATSARAVADVGGDRCPVNFPALPDGATAGVLIDYMAGKLSGHFRLFSARGCTGSVAGGKMGGGLGLRFGEPPLCWLWGKCLVGKKYLSASGQKTEKLQIEPIEAPALEGNGSARVFFHFLTVKTGQDTCAMGGCVSLKWSPERNPARDNAESIIGVIGAICGKIGGGAMYRPDRFVHSGSPAQVNSGWRLCQSVACS